MFARAWVALFAVGPLVGCGGDEVLDTGSRLGPNGADAGADGGRGADAGGSAGAAPSFGGGEGPYFEAVDEGFDALLGIQVSYAEFFCECEVAAASGPEFDACVDGYTEPYPPPLLYCSKEVLSQSEEALDALECELASANLYIACLHESTCLDFGHITDCEIDRILRETECEEVPYPVWAADQERCYGREVPPAFACDGGTLLDPGFVCDLVPDCEDGTDEQDCANPHGNSAL